jgi:hypothetical protein
LQAFPDRQLSGRRAAPLSREVVVPVVDGCYRAVVVMISQNVTAGLCAVLVIGAAATVFTIDVVLSSCGPDQSTVIKRAPDPPRLTITREPQTEIPTWDKPVKEWLV